MTVNSTETPAPNGNISSKNGPNGTNGADQAADSAEKLISELPATHTLPLWAQMAKLNPPEPNPTCIPHVWRYDELKPYLLRAGALISEQQAERRVLMLINPAREAPYTTDTLYAGLQLVMPNETAPAHRHVAFAMRFVIEGSGGFTAVDGRRIAMHRGDVILTPTWNWHDRELGDSCFCSLCPAFSEFLRLHLFHAYGAAGSSLKESMVLTTHV